MFSFTNGRLFVVSTLCTLSSLSCLAQDIASTLNKDCPCGFYDDQNDNLFTESLIVYFNETGSFPENDFKVQSYTHKYEKGWNSVYRQGASEENVKLGNSSDDGDSKVFQKPSLELFVNPSDSDHLVVGGGIESIRQDMQFGSFAALVRSPRKWNGGSSMTMTVYYNDSETFDISMQNTNNNESAWVSMLLSGEFPKQSSSVGLNYTTLGNTSEANYTGDPWDFKELRVDWSQKSINFSIGGVLARNVSGKDDANIPTVPGPLFFKHWAVGDKYQMGKQPPLVRSVANVGWVRSFFNSTTMTTESREEFDTRCDISSACLMSDMTIRGSTGYGTNSTIQWKQKVSDPKLKIWSIVIVSFCSVISFSVLANGGVQKWKAHRSAKRSSGKVDSSGSSVMYTRDSSTARRTSDNSPQFLTSSHSLTESSTIAISTSDYPQASSSATTIIGSARNTIVNSIGNHSRLGSLNNMLSITDGIMPAGAVAELKETKEEDKSPNYSTQSSLIATRELPPKLEQIVEIGQAVAPGAAAVTPASRLTPVRQRVDYLAGIVALCSILVTMSHFALTFLPALDMGQPAHYKSELWARKTIGPYLLNPIWLGLFFTTSTRFLIGSYLRTGNLKGIAEKAVARTFRLMIPVAGVVVLEYFLMDCGATRWLEYLPSISWSTWPYTVRYQNFGTFLNELLGLVYLIPNAAPQITFNFATGVLWTIPVSLQGSWISLLGILIVYEIKTVWKRFTFYLFCIVVNWYARAWGGYFWVGMALADLDIKFNYRKWLYARPIAHWSLLIACFTIVITMLSNDLLLVWFNIDLLSMERGIHPDAITGLPIAQTDRAGYPFYYEPRVNGIFFAGAIQTGVEISPWIQKIMGSKAFMWVFPHIFTIYLFHGLMFWSLGSVVCVQLSAIGLPYWANMLITAIVCWGSLFGILEGVTPAVELLGKHVTAVIWLQAYERPAKKFPTLFPFTKEFLLGRKGADPHHNGDVVVEEVENDKTREISIGK